MNVAFVGPIGSGKTTACEALIARRGGKRLSFAYALKYEVASSLIARVLGDEWEEQYREVQERLDACLSALPSHLFEVIHFGDVHEVIALLSDPSTKAHFRDIQQWWGTEFRREENLNYWVDRLVEKVIPNEGPYYVDDCRFQNEYSALQKLGFAVVLLERNPNYPEDAVRDAHESERHWPSFPYDLKSEWIPLDKRIDLVMGLIEEKEAGMIHSDR